MCFVVAVVAVVVGVVFAVAFIHDRKVLHRPRPADSSCPDGPNTLGGSVSVSSHTCCPIPARGSRTHYIAAALLYLLSALVSASRPPPLGDCSIQITMGTPASARVPTSHSGVLGPPFLRGAGVPLLIFSSVRGWGLSITALP